MDAEAESHVWGAETQRVMLVTLTGEVRADGQHTPTSQRGSPTLVGSPHPRSAWFGPQSIKIREESDSSEFELRGALTTWVDYFLT